jgi:hypothetical protein
MARFGYIKKPVILMFDPSLGSILTLGAMEKLTWTSAAQQAAFDSSFIKHGWV